MRWEVDFDFDFDFNFFFWGGGGEMGGLGAQFVRTPFFMCCTLLCLNRAMDRDCIVHL